MTSKITCCMKNNSGVTLIEMLIVVAIIAIIGAPIMTVTIYAIHQGKEGDLNSEQQDALRLASYSLYKDIKNASSAEVIADKSGTKSNSLKLYFDKMFKNASYEYTIYTSDKGNFLKKTYKKNGQLLEIHKYINNVNTADFKIGNNVVRYTLRTKITWDNRDIIYEIKTAVKIGGI